MKNIKNFPKLELDFMVNGHPRTWTAVLGQNGLGKSTLLQAIGAALAGPGAIRELVPVADGWVSHGSPYGEIEVELLSTEGDAQTANRSKKTPYIVRYAVTGTTAEGLPVSLAEQYTVPSIVDWRGEGSAKELEKISKHMKLLKQTAYAEGKSGWFACGYGPFRRLSGGAQAAERILYAERKSARFITLFREDAALTNATEWLVALYNKGRDGDTSSQRSLEQVKLALKEELLLPQRAELSVNASSAKLKFDDQPAVPFHDLSDGYRSILALVIDLLRWATIAFPNVPNLLKASGVVLIDELDAHAHPAWQRTIGHGLRRAFPNLQFIITTHSPFLAQVANESGGNVVLEKTATGIGKREDVAFVETWRADQILTDLLELPTTRSPEVERKIKRIQALSQLRQQHSALPSEQQKEYDQLRLWMESLPPALEALTERRQAEKIQVEVNQAAAQLRELE